MGESPCPEGMEEWLPRNLSSDLFLMRKDSTCVTEDQLAHCVVSFFFFVPRSSETPSKAANTRKDSVWVVWISHEIIGHCCFLLLVKIQSKCLQPKRLYKAAPEVTKGWRRAIMALGPRSCHFSTRA